MPDDESVVPVNLCSRSPLVSIIIPCYNGRRFISEAIESALAQTHRNIEIVVVDDGSTDGSPAIAKSYPVHFEQGEHKGVSTARNRGILASKGEYLVLLDCDDRLLPGAIAAGLELLEMNPACCMAVGGHNIITQSGERVLSKEKPVPLLDGFGYLLRCNFIECTSSVLFRRSHFTRGIEFRSDLTGAEDYEVYLRLARTAPMCCHRQVVSEYRLHASNSSHDSKMMLVQTLAVLSEQWPFARKSLRHMIAFVSGSLYWRRKYGRRLTVEMAMSDSESQLQDDKTSWGLLARSYPQGILVVLISRILPTNLVRSMLQGTVVDQAR